MTFTSLGGRFTLRDCPLNIHFFRRNLKIPAPAGAIPGKSVKNGRFPEKTGPGRRLNGFFRRVPKKACNTTPTYGIIILGHQRGAGKIDLKSDATFLPSSSYLFEEEGDGQEKPPFRPSREGEGPHIPPISQPNPLVRLPCSEPRNGAASLMLSRRGQTYLLHFPAGGLAFS
jgi:hypothetical protein